MGRREENFTNSPAWIFARILSSIPMVSRTEEDGKGTGSLGLGASRMAKEIVPESVISGSIRKADLLVE